MLCWCWFCFCFAFCLFAGLWLLCLCNSGCLYILRVCVVIRSCSFGRLVGVPLLAGLQDWLGLVYLHRAWWLNTVSLAWVELLFV